jgi:hypothetical protein
MVKTILAIIQSIPYFLRFVKFFIVYLGGESVALHPHSLYFNNDNQPSLCRQFAAHH